MNLYISLGSMVILTILILTIHEHIISFHLFLSSSIYFTKVCCLYVQVFTFLVIFIPRYFNLFDTIIHKISLLIYLFGSLLLVYRNATDFCILILYSATWLNSLISSNNFLVESLGFSICNILSSANNNSFTISFPISLFLLLA